MSQNPRKRREIDIHDFARRVERVCDFLISQAERDGSDDIVVLQELKDEAADIHFGNTNTINLTIKGLSDYMKGVSAS